MTVLKPDLETAVKTIFRDAWSSEEGQVVPESEDLAMGNHAKNVQSGLALGFTRQRISQSL
jgi:hypothetical protein